jgi:hypothetical protein
MASSGKKRTTMAKLNREARLRERRVEKEARKFERKHAAANPSEPDDVEGDLTDQPWSEAEVSRTP